MLQDILKDIFVTIVCAGIIYMVKTIWNWLTLARSEQQVPEKTNNKRLRKQFFFALFLLVASIVTAINLSSMIAFVFAGFSFIVVWGAFDAAMEFYPLDEVIPKPTNNTSKNNKNK